MINGYCTDCHRCIEVHASFLPELQSLAVDCAWEPGGPEGCEGAFGPPDMCLNSISPLGPSADTDVPSWVPKLG